MKRNAFIISLLSFFCMTTQAQQIEIFEPAMMEVEYNKKMVRDTLNRENDFISEAVRLRIGKKTSMFYSPKELWYDSLSCNQELKTQVFLQYSRSKGKLSAPAGFYKERVYKNHPVGKITVFNRFDLCHWTYTEDWEKPQWELTDSTKTVLNLPCQLAISQYRGRTWYAWFTIDIPISEGLGNYADFQA